jgi:hypothetical protein
VAEKPEFLAATFTERLAASGQRSHETHESHENHEKDNLVLRVLRAAPLLDRRIEKRFFFVSFVLSCLSWFLQLVGGRVAPPVAAKKEKRAPGRSRARAVEERRTTNA